MRRAVRSLLRTPGYTAIALATLALGLGVAVSMFSVVDALLFRTGPFPQPDRLVQLTAVTRNGEGRIFSATELNEIRGQSPAFTALTTLCQTRFSLAASDRPAERLGGVLVSADFFSTFGLSPLLGRAFLPEEHQPGRNQVVLLSHAFWRERYGAAPDVLGRTLRLDGDTVTIVGVMPPSFDYPPLWGDCALWRPLNFTPDQLQWRDYRAFHLVGRLAPGATAAGVAAALAPLAAAQAAAHPESYSDLRYRAPSLAAALTDPLSHRLSWLLLALSGFVLLIACANLANLQLARATARLRDLAIRAALGASRTRLALQQLTESLVLSLAGGALGLALAAALNRLIEQPLQAAGTLGGAAISLHGGVLAAAGLATVLTGLLFGLVPAWLATRTDVNAALKSQSRGSTSGRGHHRIRESLIVAEVALAFVLLAGAAVLQRGFTRLLERHSGWDTDRILTASLAVPETRITTDPQRYQLYRQLAARLAALPGVEHAALATSLPITSYNGERAVLLTGQTPADSARLPAAFHVMVTSDFFATLGLPLVAGRLFPAEVKPTDPRVVVINESLARRLWPDTSAVGQRLGSMDSGQPYWAEVIGVVRDVDSAASTRDPSTPYQVYKHLAFEPWSGVQLVVRSAAPASLAPAVRRAIAEVDPDLAADHISTIPQMVAWQQQNLRLAARALGGFAVLGLLLAAVGLYGVIAQLVAQRTAEFGVRLALGSSPRALLALVLGHGLRLIVLGLVLGLAGAYVLARFLGSLLPRMAGPAPLTLAAVAAFLFATAALACWWPARRATRVDPLTALRAE